MKSEQTNNLTAANYSLANEIAGILLLMLAVLLFLCLLTYSAVDASLNAASGQATGNFIGAIGANVATLLFQGVGLIAFVVPVLLVWTAWRTFWAESLFVPVSRIAGFVLLLISLAAMLPLFGLQTFFDRSVPAGGLIGTLTAAILWRGLGTIGALVLLAAIAAAAFLLVTGFSYAPVVVQFQIWFAWLQSQFRQWRTREAAAAKDRFEKRRIARAEALKRLNEKTYANDFTQTVAPEVEPQSATTNNQTETFASRLPLEFLKTKFDAAFEAVKTFARRLQESPKFVDDNNAPQAENEIVEPDADKAEIAASNDFGELPPRKIKPPKIEIETRGENSLPADSETDDEFPDEIPIQPLKSGDAADFELEETREIEEQSQAISNNPKSKVQNPKSEYELPTTEFLNAAPARIQHQDQELLDIAKTLESKCAEFKAKGKVVNICPGPVVTTYEYKLETGVQFKVISGLVDDLCLGLQAESVRIDRIPGKAFVGIEVPNPRRETIFLREVVESKAFRENSSLLSLALGKTADGLNYTTDLQKMPHLLIAGATGAGKSVGVNSIIVSILYKAKPDEVKFIMVDPKQVELNLYADIPHLATPIITDPKRAAIALKWAVAEMERRYKSLSGWFVRNIEGYNSEVRKRNSNNELDENGEAFKSLPYLVIIIDEFADLMIVARGEVEESIMRLVAKARAVGIHLILATQRPSVDVVTGVIKANFPCRIGFRVSSGIDSKTIVNTVGAEHLLGRGDMLFLPSGASKLLRVHGAFVDESEIHKIVDYVKAQSAPEYDTTITQTEEEAEGDDFVDETQDDLFADALKICVEMKRASTSVLQRRLSIGYGRAAKIIDAMERAGYVGASEGASKPRPILSRAVERVQEWHEQESH